MNKAQKFVYWLDKKSKLFELIETKRADWFERTFDIREWFRDSYNLLDVGSGVCDVTQRISNYVKGKVYAIDIEDFRRVGTKNNVSFNFCIANAMLLPFKNFSFDCVTVLWTLHHSPNPMAILREINRILTHGGQLIILEDLVDNSSSIRRNFTKFYDKAINLEFSTHPHSNYSLREWEKMIVNELGYKSVELEEIPWFTKLKLLKFGLLRFKKE